MNLGSEDQRQHPTIVTATCGVCGGNYPLDSNGNFREGKLCLICGSSGRSQAIAYAVSQYVFRQDRPLVSLDKRVDVKILGLSDAQIYAKALEQKCRYINTYYHKAPYLNIMKPGLRYRGRFDALISADVFEHAIGPPAAAFKGAYKILKTGGYLVLTVPFSNSEPHREHYPGLVNYTSEEISEGIWVAHLEFQGGTKTLEESPCFHGGPGKTLELRLFNRARLKEELTWAGFHSIHIQDENIPERGINWSPFSRLIVAQK